MLSDSEKAGLLFRTIGWPIGNSDFVPDAATIESLTEFAFKSRVGLLFLDECVRKGAELGPDATELHKSLSDRRLATDEVVVRLARRLDEVAPGEWVLFKSIKPFASTPNDTDWFPLDPKRHQELCDHLVGTGDFKLMEIAPRQTTLIEVGGVGVTDTTKKGGVYYIDCYVMPSTDYFVYLDQRRMRHYVTETTINGYPIPILEPHAELTSIVFHNVFPERSFSPESYYLIKRYLDLIEEAGSLSDFVKVCKEQKVELAAAHNLAVAHEIDRVHFDHEDPRIVQLLVDLGHPALQPPGFDAAGRFPFEFPNLVFWAVFFSKLRDRTSLFSVFVQLLHMLNPVFFADVIKIIWRRCFKGGVYEQN
jgi:hypothetical protein